MGIRDDTISAMDKDAAPFKTELSVYKVRESAASFTGKLPLIVDLGKRRVVTVLSAETVNGGKALKLTIKLTQRGKDITPPTLNPWVIVNPPMLVPDPAGDVVRTWVDDEEDGGAKHTERYREDPLAVIIDLIRRKFT